MENCGTRRNPMVRVFSDVLDGTGTGLSMAASREAPPLIRSGHFSNSDMIAAQQAAVNRTIAASESQALGQARLRWRPPFGSLCAVRRLLPALVSAHPEGPSPPAAARDAPATLIVAFALDAAVPDGDRSVPARGVPTKSKIQKGTRPHE